MTGVTGVAATDQDDAAKDTQGSSGDQPSVARDGPDLEAIPDAEVVLPEAGSAETRPDGHSNIRPDPVPDRPDPAPATPPPAQITQITRAVNPVPLVIGGVIAAAIGFALAQAVPNGWPIGGDPAVLAALRADLDAEKARADGLASDLASLGQKVAELPRPDDTLPGQLAGLQQALNDLRTATDVKVSEESNKVAELDGRIAVLERRPVTGGAASDTALAAYEAEIKALRDLVEAQQKQSSSAGADIAAIAATAKAEVQAAEERAAALQAQAEDTARLAMARSAVQRIRAAIEAGGGFASAIDDLSAAGISVPEDLKAQSAGVATLQSLQFAFADPARAALSASLKATVGDGAMARIGAFLRNQVGARSLSAKEGPDPDAILSRVEAALRVGDLAGSLTEIAALPTEGQAALADWAGQAQTRLTALSSAEALAKGLEN